MEVKHSFLVETCLLTHGLRSIADDEILSAWPDGLSCITWVDEGSIRIGSAAEYILFRRRCRELGFGRIDSEGLEEALSSGGSGALTASGTMAVCERLGVPLAVTCGMGGICDIKGEELCPDLPALRDIPVSLIATAPKDMLDIDRWAIARTAELQAEVIKLGDQYDFHTLVSQLHAFASEDLGSFYLDILKDRLYTTKADSHPRRSAQTALWHINVSPPDGPGSDLHGRRGLCGLQPE